MGRAFLAGVLLIGVCAVGFGQGYPVPAKTPETTVSCATCGSNGGPGKTVGYKAPISTFSGRFLDSSMTADWFDFRTARAYFVLIKPEVNRIYFRYGNGSVAAYTLSTFFNRLESGEQLVFPLGNFSDRNNNPEVFLKWDEWFNPEFSNWQLVRADGSIRMPSFDVDDKGFAYIASTIYGWGIVKDGMSTGGGKMVSMFQRMGDGTPHVIAALKAGGHYYAYFDTRQPLWDVTGARVLNGTPVQVKISVPPMPSSPQQFAKNAAADHFAVISGGALAVYDVASFVGGSGPQFTSSTTGYVTIASDGSNFYGIRFTGTQAMLDVFAPAGAGWVPQASNPIDAMSSPGVLRVGEGYASLTGRDDTEELFVYRLNSAFVPARVPISASPADAAHPDYFRNYYMLPPSGYIAPAGSYSHFADSRVYRAASGKLYLIVCASGLGDVYELAGGDTIAPSNDGAKGTRNQNAPAAGTAIYYGDPVQFTGKTTSPNIASVSWNFGNPEGGNLNSQQTTGPNQPITYQYSNLTKNTLGTKTVTASNVSDAQVKGQVSVNLQNPAARFGIAGTLPLKYLFAQPDASSPAPIVLGDTFVDASDGTVESHYASWTLDGTTTKGLPGQPAAVGQCGSHSLVFTAVYGPYNPTAFTTIHPASSTIAPDFVVGLDASNGAFNYMVRPFAAALQITGSTATTITFGDATRVTADAAVLAAMSTGLTYKWEVVNGSGTVMPVPAGSGTTYTIQKQDLNGINNPQVRLTVTSAALNGTSCAGLESSVALSAPLNSPDPQVSRTGDCVNTPCTYSVSSIHGVNTTADAWTYKWYVNGVSGNNANVSANSWTGSAFSPTFLTTGQYTMTVDVTNAIGTTNASGGAPISITVNPCGTLGPNSFVPVFQGPTPGSGCTQWSSCNSGETVSFMATSPLQGGYNPNCGSHTYSWQFPDGGTGSGISVDHVVTRSGTVTLTVTNPNGSRSYTVNLTVGSSQPPPPPPTPCSGMTAQQVFPSVTGSTCPNGGTCGTNDTLTFRVDTYLYSANCLASSTGWNFGDGQTTTGVSVTHRYTTDGAHTASVQIRNTAGETIAKNITVTTTPNSNSGSPCGTMSNSTIFIAYNGASCSTGQTCRKGDALTFDVQTLGFDLNCANPAYDWDFGDGSAHANTKQAQHTYNSDGAHTVTLKLTAGSQTFTRTASVTTATQGGGSCGPVTPDITLSISYANASGTCGPLGGACGVGEQLNFTVVPYLYDMSCATHTFDWDFGDGSPHGATKDVTHQYAASGTYTAHCTVNNGANITLTQVVTIGSAVSGTVQPSMTIEALQGVPNGYLFQAHFDHPEFVASWKWNFGDGTAQRAGRGTAANPAPETYVYLDDKTYTITLTAYAANGQAIGTDNAPNEPTAPPKSRAVRAHH